VSWMHGTLANRSNKIFGGSNVATTHAYTCIFITITPPVGKEERRRGEWALGGGRNIL
jgi:hypothetical protein